MIRQANLEMTNVAFSSTNTSASRHIIATPVTAAAVGAIVLEACFGPVRRHGSQIYFWVCKDKVRYLLGLAHANRVRERHRGDLDVGKVLNGWDPSGIVAQCKD